MSRMNLIKWLGLEVAVEFFNSYLLFPLIFISIISIYHSHHTLRYKLIYILLTVILFSATLLFEDRKKSLR
jgi:hypothetical protein